MAKNRKKKYKKKDKPYPPLSKLDKTVYWVISVMTAVLTMGAIYGIFDIQTYLFFENSEVLAFGAYGSVWAVVPYGFTIISIFIIIIDKLSNKRPIFGNKKVDYYNTTRHQFILPLFDKRYIDRTITKEKAVKVTVKIAVIAVLLLSTSLLSLNSLCHRYEFTETSINKCNEKGEIIESYNYEEIEKYAIRTPYHRFSPKTLGVETVGFEVTLPNGEILTPDLFSGLRDIESLYKIDKLLDGAEKSVDSDFEDYINSHNFSAEEEQMLREIYSE